MGDGFPRGISPGVRRGAVPVWDGQGWRAVPFAGAHVTSTIDLTASPLSFNSKRFDSHGFADIVNTPTKLTIPPGMGGYYHIGASFMVKSSAGTGSLDRIEIGLNSSSNIIAETEQNINFTGSWPALHTETIYRCYPGYWFEVYWTQNTGSSKTLGAQPERAPNFWLYRVGLAQPSGTIGGAG